MFSGIWILSGTVTNLPSKVSWFQDNHSYTFDLAAKELSMVVKDFDFSLTATTSPSLWLQIHLLTCWWEEFTKLHSS